MRRSLVPWCSTSRTTAKTSLRRSASRTAGRTHWTVCRSCSLTSTRSTRLRDEHRRGGRDVAGAGLVAEPSAAGAEASRDDAPRPVVPRRERQGHLALRRRGDDLREAEAVTAAYVIGAL